MDAQALRALLQDMLPQLDESTHAWLVNALVDRAARKQAEWPGCVPARPTSDSIDDIVSFAEAAIRVGYADPSDVDDSLQKGSNAFLARDYHAACQIFRALLIPIGNGDIDLGQDEMVDEVLGVDLAACAAQYVVSMYMIATPPNRGEAVLTAIDDMQCVGHFWEPLREIERVATRPLPGFEEFLLQWRALIEQRAGKERNSDWDMDEGSWLREVIGRMEGADGLAKVARSTRRADDLCAWCGALVEARTWKAALEAYEEAAELVTDKEHWRGDFLDGAALAAQELGRKDLSSFLKRAWREAPTMVRLRRWLGCANSKKVLRQRAAEALEACPEQAQRQRALLHVLLGDIEAAAKLLASAPGLGWSNSEHPGHLIFPLFCGLLGGIELTTEDLRDIDETNFMFAQDEPCLATPEIAEIVTLAGGITGLQQRKSRAAALSAMRAAAEKRIAGVTANKRRRHYGHAASLALACMQVDPTPDSASWLAALRDEYSRYPALQRELAHRHGRR
jgi:hypothetical protein